MGILGWLLGRRAPPVDEQPAPEPAPVSVSVTVTVSEPVRFRPAPPPDPRYPLNIGPIPLQLAMHVGSARAAREAGDIDAARAHYQRAAYGFNQLSPEQNEALKQEIAGLTRSDPFYLDGLELMRQQLANTPGVLQADLTRGLEPRAIEAARYVLYYADQLGDIVRVKSGRSYRLYLPGQPIPPEPPKPKRPRTKTPAQGGLTAMSARLSKRHDKFMAEAGIRRRRQHEESADSHPYWMYVAVMDPSTRPAHAAMNGRVFRHDDPIWQTHYPPLESGCRCRVRALTERQVRERGLLVESTTPCHHKAD